MSKWSYDNIGRREWCSPGRFACKLCTSFERGYYLCGECEREEVRGAMKILGWVWWGIVQLIMLAATLLGFVLLVPFCLLQFWIVEDRSIKDDTRPIDVWKWTWLNRVYGNPEDGVSGQTALIWGSGAQAGQLVHYMPNAWAPWRAYCWSAWRNSCDALKYRFAWKNGPRAQIGNRKIGWWTENGFNVPLL